MNLNKKNTKDKNKNDKNTKYDLQAEKKSIDFFKKLKSNFFKLLFPENVTCDICGAELVAKTRYNLCGECTQKLPFNKGKVCSVCGSPIGDEADFCIRCQNTESRFEKNRSPLVYENEASKMILSLKFGGKKYLANTLSALMTDTFIENNFVADVLVFVPMTKTEQKRRGFNQSELLAKNIGERLNIPVLEGLIKIKETSLQKELSAKKRAQNLEGAFIAVPEIVKNKAVVLIDDVFTTGSTANECAKALHKARAERVNVLTAAVTKQRIFME